MELSKRSIAKGFGWSLASNFVVKAVLPIVGLLIARYLGPQQVGIYALFLLVLSIADILREAGLTQSYISDRELTPGREGVYTWLGVGTGAVLAAAALALSGPIAQFFSNDALREHMVWIAVAVMANGVSTVPAARLMKEGRFRAYGVAESGSAVVSYGVAALLVWQGYGFLGLVAQLAVRAVLFAGLCIWKSPPTNWGFDGASVGPVVRNAGALLSASALGTLFLIVDSLIVGRFLGETALGLYNVAKTMALRPIDFLAMPLNRTVFPFYSKASGDKAKIGSIFSRSIVGSALFVMPLSAFLAVFAEPVTRALYGDAFGSGSVALRALSIAMAVRTVGTFSGSLLVAIGKSPLCTLAWLSGGAVTAAILVLSPTLSLASVAWGFAAGFAAVYGIMIAAAFGSVQVPSDQRTRLAKALFANVGTLALMLAVNSLPLGPWPMTGVAVAICPAAHLALVGLLLAGKPFEYFSPRGVRRFWQDL